SVCSRGTHNSIEWKPLLFFPIPALPGNRPHCHQQVRGNRGSISVRRQISRRSPTRRVSFSFADELEQRVFPIRIEPDPCRGCKSGRGRPRKLRRLSERPTLEHRLLRIQPSATLQLPLHRAPLPGLETVNTAPVVFLHRFCIRGTTHFEMIR